MSIRELIIDLDLAEDEAEQQKCSSSGSGMWRVERREERRAAVFLLCYWLPASPAASVMCVSSPGWSFLSVCLVLLQAAERLRLFNFALYVYVRGRVGRPLLPRENFRVGRRFFWSVWYNSLLSILFNIVYIVYSFS